MAGTEGQYPEVVEYMNEVPCFNSYNNIKLVRLEDGYAEGRVELSCNSMNPNGKVHGGLLFACSDYIGGFVACTDNKAAVTESGNISFLRPATGDYLTVKATPVKLGAKVAIVDVCVYDDHEKLVSKGTFTYFSMLNDF